MAFRDRLAWIPVGLLIGVALTHAYRVEALQLTPWKGGGFGMFSTLDGNENRHLIVKLLDRHGENGPAVSVDLPARGPLRKLADKAQAMSTEARVKSFAAEIAKQPWRLPKEMKSDRPINARIVTDKAMQVETRLVPFQEVEVTVWRLAYEHRGEKVSAKPELLRTVRVSKRRPPGSRGVSR